MDRVNRLARALAPQLEQMIGLMQSRIAGHDDVVFDKLARSVLYSKEGRVLWRAQHELIGRYSRDLGIFRWWWVGRAPGAADTKMDTAYGEAQRLELQALLDKQMVLETVEDARHMARLAAHLAGADGVIDMEEARDGDDLTLAFYALFDTWHGGEKSKRPSFAVSRTMPPPVSIPPVPPLPRVQRPTLQRPPTPLKPSLSQPPAEVREPARALLDALVPPLHDALISAEQDRFRQALVTVNVEGQGPVLYAGRRPEFARRSRVRHHHARPARRRCSSDLRGRAVGERPLAFTVRALHA